MFVSLSVCLSHLCIALKRSSTTSTFNTLSTVHMIQFFTPNILQNSDVPLPTCAKSGDGSQSLSQRRRRGSVVGGHHGECRARAYNEGLGAESPAGSRGRAPGQGVRPPPEAESILVTGCPTEPANLAPFQNVLLSLPKTVCFVTVHWCQSWGPRVHGAPQPRHWGACAPGSLSPRLRRLWFEQYLGCIY